MMLKRPVFVNPVSAGMPSFIPAGAVLRGSLIALFLIACVPQIDNSPPSDAGPEYGLYWYGKNDANQIFLPDEPNPFYDSTKPTIIFVHGWQPDQAYTHRTMLWEFSEADSEEEVEWDLAASWIDAGWNVGIFDWGPFADEEIVLDAEAKIWTIKGSRGMRWRDQAGLYHSDEVPAMSTGELFYHVYVEALQGFSGPELRLAGHSLGNQMAVHLLRQLASEIEEGTLPARLFPDRLALLDPYWSPLEQDYLAGETTADRVRGIIEEVVLARSIPVEWYRSSSLTDGRLISSANEALQSRVIFTELRPRYCSQAEQICKHEAAWQSYFLSFGSPPPAECELSDLDDSCTLTGRAAASAATGNERLSEMMVEPYRWLQVAGAADTDSTLTRATDDDWFARYVPEAVE